VAYSDEMAPVRKIVVKTYIPRLNEVCVREKMMEGK
jgi:hypothetical protein